MIVYDPLWDTLRKKGLSTYTLRVKFQISGSTVQRLRKNMSVSTNTLDDLCNLLDCALSEIAAHVPEKMTAEELRNKYHKQYGAAPNAMLHRFVMGSSKNAGIMRFLLPPAHLRMGFFPACFGLVCYWGNTLFRPVRDQGEVTVISVSACGLMFSGSISSSAAAPVIVAVFLITV